MYIYVNQRPINERKYVVYLLKVWFACINVVMPSFTHLPENDIFFFCLHRTSMPHFLLYSFIDWWTPTLVVLNLGYCEACYIKHACTSISVMCWLGVLQARSDIAGPYDSSCFNFFFWETSMMHSYQLFIGFLFPLTRICYLFLQW